LAKHLCPISGLITKSDIRKVRQDWGRACDATWEYAKDKTQEVAHLMRVHRDPVEQINPILKSHSPLGEYRKIVEEILKRLPDQKRYPVAAAEAMRSYLLLRLGLHMGVRQKHLRDLHFCPKGMQPKTERELESGGHGEIRWVEQKKSWEIFIPGISFKNAKSSFFQHGAYQLVLPRLAGLNNHIGAYVRHHRPILLGGFPDPGTFFVRTLRSADTISIYSPAALYEEWKLTIQLYGIHNPYTGRGAVKGILPHGPHCIRDVIATHVLKQTGSLQLAAFAIQTTPETVFKHYGRFLPREKLALAATVLNEVWRSPGRRAKKMRRGPVGSLVDHLRQRRISRFP